MSKATIQDVIDLGFSADQFGGPEDFSVEDSGYVFRVLDDASIEVRAEVGSSAYDAADAGGSDSEKLSFKRIKNAEMYLSGAVLWRRIEVFERSNKVQGRESGSAETISSRALKNAMQFEATAWESIERITGKAREAGSSFGYVESGPYAQVGT